MTARRVWIKAEGKSVIAVVANGLIASLCAPAAKSIFPGSIKLKEA